MLTALVGVGFWAVAARNLAPSELGVQTALLSAIVAPAIVVASGVGDAFTSLLPRSGGARLALVRRGYLLILLSATAVGIVSAVVSVTVLEQVRGSYVVAGVVAAGTVVWALFAVQDSALTSMGRARWLPVENGIVSIAKVTLLPVLAVLAVGVPIVTATLIPAGVAVVVILPKVLRLARRGDLEVRRTRADAETNQAAFRQLRALVWRTTLSVALTLGALTFLPFVVTAVSGPTQGAVFALCLSITQSLDFVGAAFGVSLVVHASTPGADSVRLARIVFLRAVSIVGAGALVLVVASPLVLRVMNPAYLELRGVAVIVILAASSVLRTVFVTWSALQRSRRAMRPILILNSVGAITLYATVPVLSGRWGAIGAALSLAGAQTVLSLGAALHLAWNRNSPVRRWQLERGHAGTVPRTEVLVATGGRA
jgi:O-antigen/teichoic acid export membrane protein